MALEADSIIMISVGMTVCAFLVKKGALELFTLLMVPAIGYGVMTLKVFLPPEVLILVAMCVSTCSLLSVKGLSFMAVVLLALLAGGCILIMKFYIPIKFLVSIAMSMIFLAMVKMCLF